MGNEKIDIIGNVKELSKFKKSGKNTDLIDNIQKIKSKASDIANSLTKIKNDIASKEEERQKAETEAIYTENTKTEAAAAPKEESSAISDSVSAVEIQEKAESKTEIKVNTEIKEKSAIREEISETVEKPADIMDSTEKNSVEDVRDTVKKEVQEPKKIVYEKVDNYPDRKTNYQNRGEYQNNRYQNQNGGYQNNNYQNRGDYANNRYQNQSGGYQNNGYQNRSNQQGGLPNRNNPNYRPNTQNPNPRFNNQRNQSGGFTPRTQNGGFQPRANQIGGFRPNNGGQPFNKDFKKPFTPGLKKPFVAAPGELANNANKYTNKIAKKKTGTADEKKSLNKRTLLKKGFIADETLLTDAEFAIRKLRRSKNPKDKVETIVITSAVVNSEVFPIKTLSEKIGKTSAEIVKQLFSLGIMKTINDDIVFDEAELVSNELGVSLSYVPSETFEDKLDQLSNDEDNDTDLESRPPIVTIMGHVDHGKTTLLDYIRKANVASGEAGGITQHIGAYTAKVNNQTITFLDTPGHEAFTSMRLRGAQATDIAIIVVAADDGIMPQTVEAINHAKIAGVEIIIAITKIDKPEVNPDRILQQLTDHDILPEAWGGSTPVCKVSAKTGEGVNELLETVLLVAEMLELKASPDRLAKGIIIEAKLDKGRGPVATVLVQNGTLNVSDFVVAGTTTGKIRAMFNSKGLSVKSAGPSTPVSVLGFSEVPTAGDQLIAVAEEKLAKQVAEERRDKIRSQQKSTVKMNLEDMMNQIAIGDLKELKIVVKADVQGSVEAVKQALEKISNEEVKVRVVHGAAGAVNESDVMLAETSNAIVIAFNVRPDNNAKNYAEKNNIDIRTYRVIYDAIDDVEKAMKGMLSPKFKEVVYGSAEVRETFKVSNVGVIGGCMVVTGKVVRNSKLRLVRDGVIITEGEISSLKRFKDDVKEVAKGYECGIGIEGFNDIKVGDVIESYNMEQINE